MHVESELVGRRATLIFQTTHIDRGGETGNAVSVHAEIVAIDEEGNAVLISEGGVHLRFPAALLYQLGTGKELLGGQELVRDFHNGDEPIRTRWLARDELEALLADIESR